MSIPATSFTLFNSLPQELRILIWKHALPGPRIIHVEHHVVEAADGMYFSYLRSTSPDPIVSLLAVCEDSKKVVKQHYSIIFTLSSTWFCFETDFLYLDWGWKYEWDYGPEDLAPSSETPSSGDLGDVKCIGDTIRRVKNLVLFDGSEEFIQNNYNNRQAWLVRSVLPCFPALEVLVFADVLHSRFEDVGHELVWLRGGMNEELVVETVISSMQPSIYNRSHDLELLLWRDYTEYKECYPFNLQILQGEWQKWNDALINRLGDSSQRYQMPKIVRKGVVSATLKKQLLEICGSEENLHKLESIDWPFVKGKHTYDGGLSLSQQIAFLELVLGRVTLADAEDSQGSEARGTLTGGIPILLWRIERLLEEQALEDMVLQEAEDMI